MSVVQMRDPTKVASEYNRVQNEVRARHIATGFWISADGERLTERRIHAWRGTAEQFTKLCAKFGRSPDDYRLYAVTADRAPKPKNRKG